LYFFQQINQWFPNVFSCGTPEWWGAPLVQEAPWERKSVIQDGGGGGGNTNKKGNIIETMIIISHLTGMKDN
jgi:hypothetical protein